MLAGMMVMMFVSLKAAWWMDSVFGTRYAPEDDKAKPPKDLVGSPRSR